MEKNHKIIIIILIAIIAILLIGMALVMPNFNKKNASITFKGNATLNEGDSLEIKLTDDNGNVIVGQTVNITVTDKNKTTSFYSVETNDEGVGSLKLDKDAGEYDITATYNGNDNYKGCNATKKITISAAEAESSSSQSSSSPSAYAYKSDGTPMYSQSEVDRYMLNKYGMVDYHVGSNGYIDMDEPGYDNAGNPLY